MALFDSEWIFTIRFRWFDVPMATLSLFCPFVSSLSNSLGLYDGCSAAFGTFVTWGLPYLIGRVYFTRLEHLRELALGIVVGGLIYVPLCVWELRMSPRLHYLVYGFQSGWAEMAFGGFRAKVFMSCALETALWMTVTATTGLWLWGSRAVVHLHGFPFGWLLLALTLTAMLGRCAGAYLLMILGFSLWYLLKWSGSRLPAVALVLVPLLYISTRVSGVWTGEDAVNLVRSLVNERRADSLDFRMRNEDLLATKALQQPLLDGAVMDATSSTMRTANRSRPSTACGS
jgi:hypothetical protein